MKFTKDGPDIPLNLLYEHEKGNVVFFCGAGISYRAGLMGFEKLVDRIYDYLCADFKRDEQLAYDQKLFDQVLELLERRFESSTRAVNYQIREAISNILTIEEDADISIHKSILELSTHQNNSIRLVTTNFDNGFKLASNGKRVPYDVAPKLPTPKNHKWSSIVYLHGLIDKINDPMGQSIVTTSGDFGTAYLIERWASRFVSELFQRFQVVFIGYSVNDPVLRYMTDAIAAETRKGEKSFRHPYAIVGIKPKNINTEIDAWKSKGVKPLFYNSKDNHIELKKFLIKWSDYYKDGLAGKEKIISKASFIEPIAPYDDEDVKKIISLISSSPQQKDYDYCAKLFSKLDPIPPIQWLNPLKVHGLLERAIPQNKCPIGGYIESFPDHVTQKLWFWLSKHIDKPELIEYIVECGGHLHSDFKRLIEYEVNSRKDLRKDIKLFWHLITSELVGTSNLSFDRFSVHNMNFDKRLFNEKPLIDVIELEKKLEPMIKIKVPFNFTEDINSPQYQLFTIEMHVRYSLEHHHREINLTDIFPANIDSLSMITNKLLHAMKMWESVEKADGFYDVSYSDMPSISPHEQNNYCTDSWTLLIELCRDLWINLFSINKKDAMQIISWWKKIKYPIFRRLVLYAYVETDIVNNESSIKFLFNKGESGIWNSIFRRENLQLISHIWPTCSETQRNKLIDAFVSGPSKDLFMDDTKYGDYIDQKNHLIWIFLNKIKKLNLGIPDKAKNKLRYISRKYPKWTVEETDRDEFSTWHETRFGHETDVSEIDLFTLPVFEVIKLLKEHKSNFIDGRLDKFQNICTNKHQFTFKVLEYLLAKNDWDIHIWKHALLGLAENNEYDIVKLIEWLLKANKTMLTKEPWVLAWWSKGVIKSKRLKASDEGKLIRLWTKLLRNNKEKSRFYLKTDMLNKPNGIIAESFMDLLISKNIRTNSGIPNKFKPFMKILMNKTLCSLSVSHYLWYLYGIDKKWTKNNLLPLFNFQKSPIALNCWYSYLWNPRYNTDLLNNYKKYFTKIINDYKHLNEVKENYLRLFISISLYYQETLSKEIKREVLKKVSDEGRVFALRALSDTLGSENCDYKFWINRIQPFISEHWPKENDYITEATSIEFARISLKFESNFDDVVQFIKPYLCSSNNYSRFLYELSRNDDIAKKYPKPTLDLIYALFKDVDNYPPFDDLSKILSIIQDSESSLASNPMYIEIRSEMIRQRF